MGVRRRFSVLALVVAAVAMWAAPTGRATPAARLSGRPVAARAAWKRYVVDPGRLAYPERVRVVGAAGAVTDPAGLVAPGGGVTTIRATGAGAPRLVLDLGVDTGGYVEVGVTRTDGTNVRLGYAELRRFLTPQGDNCSCGGLNLSIGVNDDPEGRTDVISSATPTRYRSPGIRGAERYLSLQLEGRGSVSIDYVRVRREYLRAPVSSYAGRFESSDRLLNRIWYASAHTFALDAYRDLRPGHRSRHVVVTDGAKRDRLIWIGDLGLENLLGAYSLRPAPRIVQRSLAAFSCLQRSDGQLQPATQIATTCPRTPPPAGSPPPAAAAEGGAALAAIHLPQYTAAWINAVHDVYLYTGAAGFARRMLPVIRRGLAYFEARTRHGLFVTPDEGLTINWHPFDTADGPDSYTNASLYRALHSAADLERRLGSRARARDDLRGARVLRRAMNRHLWDPRAGAFVVNGDDPRHNHTQDAQVEAVYAGVTSRARSRRALRFVARGLARRYGVANGQYADDAYMSNYISPFISSTELLARLRDRDAKGALALIRREWGHMLAAGPGTLWEKVGFDGLPANYAPLQEPVPFFSGTGAGFTSLAQGWSGGPVPALSGYVLGLRPAAPGWRRWVVAPQPGGLRFAQGRAPTPRGPVVSRWRKAPAGRAFRLTAGGPPRTSGTVEVPILGRRRAIAMDGRVVWTGRHARAGVHAHAIRGAVAFSGLRDRHTFAWGRR